LFSTLLWAFPEGTRLEKPAPLNDTPPGIELKPVLTTGLNNPVYVTNAHDHSNRLFIVEQAGVIKVLQPGSSTPTVFLDVTSKVWFGGERGLLGLTFHPTFTANRRFFVNYTKKPDGATVIAEYLVSNSNPNVAETTEKVILTIAQPFSNHNGGMIEFGPDGFLYVGMGDGGSANDPGNRAQNIEDLLGKILRIDVDNPASPTQPYTSPSSNPYFGATPGRDEIFALGMRNPWRFSFDRATGLIYAGDVGQSSKEEIDVISLGGNYGWRVFEGTLCTSLDPPLCSQSGYTAPITEYNAGCAVIGGYVYRGNRLSLPPGSYVFGDHCTGVIFLLDGSAQTMLLNSDVLISSFGEDEQGEIYVVGLSGSVYRIVNSSRVSLEIQMSNSRYLEGETVTATEFRVENTRATIAKVELKVWLKVPGLQPISFLNLGGDGSALLPAGTNQNLGPFSLFAVTSGSIRGTYEYSSRLVDPVTGGLLSEDFNTFLIE
jgi:glucose/arabinose dehydrogenase